MTVCDTNKKKYGLYFECWYFKACFIIEAKGNFVIFQLDRNVEGHGLYAVPPAFKR